MTQNFYQLTPNHVMLALESLGFYPTGEFIQLNSYENRVFDIQLERGSASHFADRVIVKFYRPGRWSQEQILDEHQFLFSLKNEDVAVIPPLRLGLHNQ